MALYYRTDDVTRWGSGLGRNLHDYELDINFWGLDQRVAALEAAGVGNSVVDVTNVSNVVTFHYDDHAEFSITFPYPRIAFLGDFTLLIAGAGPGGIDLTIGDEITDNGSTYQVIFDHHVDSGTVFDPGANDGLGNDYYNLMLAAPANMLPVAGDVPMVLRKASATNYAVTWGVVYLSELGDVELDSDIPEGDVIRRVGGAWVNSPLVLPAPGSGVLGGVELADPELHKWVAYIDGDGVPVLTQPDFSDIAGEATEAQLALVQTKKQTVASSSGVLTVDRSLGERVKVTLAEDITSIVVNNWPAADTTGRIVFQFFNAGAFTVTGYPAGTIWPDSTGEPVVTSGAGKKTRVMLETDDNGTTIFGDLINLDYHA